MSLLFLAELLSHSHGFPTVSNSNFSKLIDFWQSKTNFCNVFSGASSNALVCLDSQPVTLIYIYIYIYTKIEEKREREREREREPFVCGKIENYAWNKRGNDNFIV